MKKKKKEKKKEINKKKKKKKKKKKEFREGIELTADCCIFTCFYVQSSHLTVDHYFR